MKRASRDSPAGVKPLSKVIFVTFVIMVMLLHAYPALELTRLIIVSGMHNYPFMFKELVLEIVSIWLAYPVTVVLAELYWKYFRE